MFKPFRFTAQHDAMDCGPACLAMISEKYGKKYSLEYLREGAFLTREGVSLQGLKEASELIGLECMAVRTSVEMLLDEKAFPCILHWDGVHFVVLYGVTKNLFSRKPIFKIADPAAGLVRMSENDFRAMWLGDQPKGVALLIEPTKKFYQSSPVASERHHIRYIYKYIRPFKKELFNVVFSLAIASLCTLCFPFLTQALIDKGVVGHNLGYVGIILLAQIFLFLGSTIIEIVRNWLILYVGARINISIISEFFKKIMRLPVKFFDTRFMGDFHQRIQDHSKIESFLTSQSLTTLFSLINFLIFFFVLFHYNFKILAVYASLTLIAIVWSRLFLKRRAQLNYFRFRTNALNQESVNEILWGINEIKLNNFENYKREVWEKNQVNVFGINLRILKLDQFQLVGFDFINQFKNIIVTFIAAREVILGNITLGGMLSISYIVGQMNSPVNQLVSFFRSLQDAQLSLKRLVEVQTQKEEEERVNDFFAGVGNSYVNNTTQGANRGIQLDNLNYRYEGPKSPLVLKNITLLIPEGKTTAIVGGSGSGKTTLLKLLLSFYEPTSGSITINGQPLGMISPSEWRRKCGVVLQDGYIFSESINRNIATSDITIDENKLAQAIETANISDFVYSLPKKGESIIGSAGNGLSGGQKQRILIARSVYKQPDFIFFDEATSALDTENEKIIHDNLKEFFKGKTVVIIAHRLSTVKNADQIIVMRDGEIVEQGNHNELVEMKKNYYGLVKNQLELDVK